MSWWWKKLKIWFKLLGLSPFLVMKLHPWISSLGFPSMHVWLKIGNEHLCCYPCSKWLMEPFQIIWRELWLMPWCCMVVWLRKQGIKVNGCFHIHCTQKGVIIWQFSLQHNFYVPFKIFGEDFVIELCNLRWITS